MLSQVRGGYRVSETPPLYGNRIHVDDAAGLFATLLHFDRFHVGGAFPLSAQLVAYVWIGIYATVPLILTVIWFRQLRAPGINEPRGERLPGWLRLVLTVQSVIMIGLGLLLFAFPTDEIRALWPWMLTPLTARAVAVLERGTRRRVARVRVQADEVPVVEAGAAYRVLVDAEAERLDQMEV